MSNIQNQNISNFGPINAEQEITSFMGKVYAWMAFALAVSGGVAYYVGSSPENFNQILPFFEILLIAELVLVIVLSWAMKKLNSILATIMFVVYSILTGMTLSVVFLVYQLGSIVSIFGVTAGIFGLMSFYGYYTKKDLTGIGTMAIFGLIGVIIATIVNFFLKNTMFNTIISAIGVIIFIVLTAYDTQKIKQMNVIGNEGTDEDRKEAILGALTLYLDFINLFLKLLQLFGKRR